jgi:hypothetical protein
MKTMYTIILCLLISTAVTNAQTYISTPINGDEWFSISDLSIYQDQVAIVGRLNFDFNLKAFLYKNNQWKSLPLTSNVDGIERNLKMKNPATSMNPKITFDNNGTIWLIAVDGLYHLENEKWIRYNLPNVNQETTTYINLIFDKNDNGWATILEVQGIGDNSIGGTRVFKFVDGKFYRYMENFDSFPLELESALANKDVFNSGQLHDGIILFGDKRYLGMNESGNLNEIVYVNSEGNVSLMDIPLIDKPIYSASLKKLNRIYVDSKNQVWFLMRFQQGFNQNTGVETACCSGIARLDNLDSWYTYTLENNTPYSNLFNDQHIRYATPVDMCELKNNEYLFVMQNNGYTEPKNLQLYKLNSQNRFDTIQWKNYLENATIYRSNSQSISEEALKNEVSILMNEEKVVNKLAIKGMKPDIHGNIWVYGSNFIIKMTDDPTTSVAESIKKPTVIYPNPGNKSIRLSSSENNVTKVELLNLTGTNVKTIDGKTKEIPVYDLSSGLYFVKIYSQNGNIEVLKFIKE